PGPGLAIRIPGEVSQEKCDILRKADAIYLEEIRNAGLYDAIWQAFAVLLPVRTVGVMGDYRTYDFVCGLRAVTSVDGMTADVYPFAPEFLSRVATRIVNEVRSEEHTSELQSLAYLVCRLLLEKKKKKNTKPHDPATTNTTLYK